MESLDELLVKQSQAMGYISCALSNLKKLGQAKLSRAVVLNRITTLKERISQSQSLDAKIRAATDPKTAESLLYLTKNHFLVCKEAGEEALDYMTEILCQI